VSGIPVPILPHAGSLVKATAHFSSAERSMNRTLLAALAMLAACSLVRGEDFNQWRGPQRNGVTAGGPKLDTRWDKSGPAKLWESDFIPGMLGDGSGCVSVAGGRAYVYVQWWYKEDIETRTVSDLALRRLGWTSRKVPEEILDAVEKARVGEDLEKLTGKPRSEWIRAWAGKHVGDAPENRAVFNYVVDRLDRGKKALPLELLAALETIRNKAFDSQAALDEWFAEHNVSAEDKAEVLKYVPSDVRKSHDTLVCLSIADGKTLFKKQFEGSGPYGSYPYGASGTPTVVDGRCYFCGSKNDVYCLDAATGELIWQVRPTGGRNVINHSSPLVLDGMVIVAASPLVALDAAKGTVLWKQPLVTTRESSPMVWRSGDRTFVLCNTDGRKAAVYCVDPRDGKVVWSVPAGGRNTVVVDGDMVVTSLVIGEFVGDPTKFGLVAYRMSAEKAEQAWSTQTYSGGGESVLIHDGYVYSFGPSVAVCIELATGRIAWTQKTSHRGWRSPVLADGKIISSDGSSILVTRATPEKYELLAKVKLPLDRYSSPAVADGRLYLRQEKNVACYDLTRPTAPAEPDAGTP